MQQSMRLICQALLAIRVGLVDAGDCRLKKSPYAPGVHKMAVSASGEKRKFLLAVPPAYDDSYAFPVLIAVPGCQPMDAALWHPEIRPAMKMAVIVVLEGCLNVERDARALAPPDGRDDVDYVQTVLRKVMSNMCIDSRRVFCTGHSRGGRFCSRLASELSDTIAAIAPYSGVQFPDPNNATRAVPVITYHATEDGTNPYLGGGHSYWQTSVPSAVKSWAHFNGCLEKRVQQVSHRLEMQRYFNCTDNAEVVLYIYDGGSHGQWFGGKLDNDPSVAMWQWLLAHPIQSSNIMGVQSLWSFKLNLSGMSAKMHVNRITLAGTMLACTIASASMILVLYHLSCKISQRDSYTYERQSQQHDLLINTEI